MICCHSWSPKNQSPPLESVRNPLAAQGGLDPELADEVRLFAPQAFRTQERAINAADYAARAQCYQDVQRADAAFQWTGSWYTVYLYIERLEGRSIDDIFKAGLIHYMDGYRLAGYDLEIVGPSYVPLNITLTVDIKTGFTPNSVMAALGDALSDRVLSAGQRGYFHPDNWTFGQPVYLSRLYAAALAVPGVAAVDATTFKRNDGTDSESRDRGLILLGPHEIVQTNSKIGPPPGSDSNAMSGQQLSIQGVT